LTSKTVKAAEAMGAISDPSSLPVLRKYLTHDNRAIRETAEIAVAKIEWDNSEEGKASATKKYCCSFLLLVGIPVLTFFLCASQFATIDPAPASSSHSPLASANHTSKSTTPVAELQTILMNTSLTLFDRYRAMFALRNDGGEQAVLALATGFQDESALFRFVTFCNIMQSETDRSTIYDRHEIAYVFGQLSSPYSIPSLVTVLRNDAEEDMVRHEAAEALGSIATDECLPILIEMAKAQGVPRVVRESCEVALDMVSLPLALSEMDATADSAFLILQ
jgi:deoxyhypusine monooxygenase